MTATTTARSGTTINFLDPDPDTLLIEDIAFSLSNLCRYTGHVEFYSVAEHSLHVSDLTPPEYQLEALLHDATEAYLGDVHTPLKNVLTQYKSIERIVHEAVRQRFLLAPEPDCVKWADRRLLATETRDLFPGGQPDWECLKGVPCMDRRIEPLPPKAARALFLDRFHYLWNMRHGMPYSHHSPYGQQKRAIANAMR